MLKAAMEYLRNLGAAADTPQVVEIDGHTYCNKSLERYDTPKYADAIYGSTLTALLDYIGSRSDEFPGDMIVHVVSPTRVALMSGLDAERKRETLFEVNAIVNEFSFDRWYDQERFMIEMQANFAETPDRGAILKMAGNVERHNGQTFSDNGTDQVVEMRMGVATKEAVLAPNPVILKPFRTFQEVDQPESAFIFRVGDKEEPAFKLVEAENGIWKNTAIGNIKAYLVSEIRKMPYAETQSRITIIG